VPDFPEEKGWRRLLADSKTVEQSSSGRTGIFPTSHAITFHSSYLEKYPSAAQEMFDACLAAKNLALRDDADATYSNFRLESASLGRAASCPRADPWKFGIKGNEKGAQRLIATPRSKDCWRRK